MGVKAVQGKLTGRQWMAPAETLTKSPRRHRRSASSSGMCGLLRQGLCQLGLDSRELSEERAGQVLEGGRTRHPRLLHCFGLEADSNDDVSGADRNSYDVLVDKDTLL